MVGHGGPRDKPAVRLLLTDIICVRDKSTDTSLERAGRLQYIAIKYDKCDHVKLRDLNFYCNQLENGTHSIRRFYGGLLRVALA
jgi:hypothetical protein